MNIKWVECLISWFSSENVFSMNAWGGPQMNISFGFYFKIHQSFEGDWSGTELISQSEFDAGQIYLAGTDTERDQRCCRYVD